MPIHRRQVLLKPLELLQRLSLAGIKVHDKSIALQSVAVGEIRVQTL
jgi:hypothetical protein